MWCDSNVWCHTNPELQNKGKSESKRKIKTKNRVYYFQFWHYIIYTWSVYYLILSYH